MHALVELLYMSWSFKGQVQSEVTQKHSNSVPEVSSLNFFGLAASISMLTNHIPTTSL